MITANRGFSQRIFFNTRTVSRHKQDKALGTLQLLCRKNKLKEKSDVTVSPAPFPWQQKICDLNLSIFIT